MSVAPTQKYFFELSYRHPSRLPNMKGIWERWEPSSSRRPFVQAICKLFRLTIAIISFPFWSPIYLLQQNKITKQYIPVEGKLLEKAHVSQKVRGCLIGIHVFAALLNIYKALGSKNVFVNIFSLYGLQVSLESIFKLHTKANETLLKWIFQKDLMAQINFTQLSLPEKEALAKLGRYDTTSINYLSQHDNTKPKGTVLENVRIIEKSL